MEKLLVVVDMQNDFVTGCLGTKEARQIVPAIADYIKEFDGDVAFTQDTHFNNYLETQEGVKLPVVHCVAGTDGWKVVPELKKALVLKQDSKYSVIGLEKNTFGSVTLGRMIGEEHYDEVYFCGVCTGICVISNALLAKAFAPDTTVKVIKDLCACVTPESHETALKAMETCQIEIV